MRVLFLTMLVLFAGRCIAQDPHFSQFYSSPLTLNPAFTGKFDGNIRFAANYRNQWPTINRAYETMTASVDFPILRNKIPATDTWGLGLMAYSDKSAAGAVAFNYFSFSTAYHKGLDEDGYKQIGAGFQATYSNMNIYTSNLKVEDQLTSLGFTGTTTDPLILKGTLSSNFLDVNAGVLYTSSSTDRDNFYAGVSMYHINRPKQSFSDNLIYLINPRTTLHAGGYLPLGPITTLHLSALYSTQAGAHETVLGGAVQFAATNVENEETPVSFYAGAWARLGDAIIPYLGLEYGQWRLGTTYDFNTSSLKAASQSRGGIEISLIYINKPEGSKGLPCPKF
jgi:type IX secretion system PorP/SprF family membrane protein